MMNGTNGMLIDPMQSMRIAKHPIQIKENLIVFDNLESGTLRIYEQMDGPVNVQQLFTRYQSIRNAVLVAEIIINSNWKNDGVFIHKVFCEDGYKTLIEPMIFQVLHFSNFYSCYESVGISDREYEKCLPNAKKALADFQKINNVYEYWLDGHGAE